MFLYVVAVLLSDVQGFVIPSKLDSFTLKTLDLSIYLDLFWKQKGRVVFIVLIKLSIKANVKRARRWVQERTLQSSNVDNQINLD